MSWLAKLLGRPNEPPTIPAAPAETGADAAAESPASGEESLSEALEPLRDALQKVGRAQARQGARLEEIESKLEAGFADLRSTVARGAGRAPDAGIRWDELLDAADALDEAVGHCEHAGQGAIAAGLRAVAARIERFLAQAEVRRLIPLGAPPDPVMVRVVGTVSERSPGQAAVADGQIARVVRAAALERGRLIREGEVLVFRRTQGQGGDS